MKRLRCYACSVKRRDSSEKLPAGLLTVAELRNCMARDSDVRPPSSAQVHCRDDSLRLHQLAGGWRAAQHVGSTDTDGDTVTVEIPDAVPESTVPEPVYKLETITLAGGCFWCIEGALQDVEGVIDAVSGYSGGEASTANYLTVSKGKTDHKEVVQITYDTNIISTERILNNFWSAIDPADAGGQFTDRGPHYTTAIFYHTDEQRKIAETSKANLNTSGLVDGEVVTEILPFANFYRAEEYHQDYYKKSAERYKRYEKASGRAGFVEDTWAREDAIAFFEEQANSAAE